MISRIDEHLCRVLATETRFVQPGMRVAVETGKYLEQEKEPGKK